MCELCEAGYYGVGEAIEASSEAGGFQALAPFLIVFTIFILLSLSVYFYYFKSKFVLSS